MDNDRLSQSCQGVCFLDSDLLAAHWNPDPTDNPALGNTLLFARALARINDTPADTDDILRGILWHQGESDTRDECACFYRDNMVKLVNALRTRIATDARGDGAAVHREMGYRMYRSFLRAAL